MGWQSSARAFVVCALRRSKIGNHTAVKPRDNVRHGEEPRHKRDEDDDVAQRHFFLRLVFEQGHGAEEQIIIRPAETAPETPILTCSQHPQTSPRLRFTRPQHRRPAGSAQNFIPTAAHMLHDLKVRTEVDKTSPFCNVARERGAGSRRCRRCNNHRGHNRKYGVNLCRRCFHAKATEIGFRSFD